jgi:hypothetical protein
MKDQDWMRTRGDRTLDLTVVCMVTVVGVIMPDFGLILEMRAEECGPYMRGTEFGNLVDMVWLVGAFSILDNYYNCDYTV